ncbi:MAG: hypothetical protein DWQ01_04135 [Planctomycetota bacterium]|nr:MAG: hypothetical protein DWQ01_04135 [Planctomycetota bacterium]
MQLVLYSDESAGKAWHSFASAPADWSGHPYAVLGPGVVPGRKGGPKNPTKGSPGPAAFRLSDFHG